MPYGPLGACAHSLLARRDLETLFDYRRQRINDRFGMVGGDGEEVPLPQRGPSFPLKPQA